MNTILEGIIIAGNFFIILFALFYNIKVLKDKTKKDFILPWKFVFFALIFFLIFEILGILENMGLLNLWNISESVRIVYAGARLGILACFLFGLILEDKHEIIEEKQIIAKMKQTKKEQESLKEPKTKKVGRYVKKKK